MKLWLSLVIAVFGGYVLDLNVLAQRQNCPDLKLENGRVRIRSQGKMAYFRCKKKFRRVGAKIAVCLTSGTWSQQTPVCVGRGCPDLGSLPDLTITELYKGGILEFQCAPGMRRMGPQKLMCDGTKWDNEPPKCLYGISLGCDFEDPGLCGWSQDENDNFDWTWTSGSTPTLDTGPEGDHTTGSGHYIFMESSAPQKSGEVTRLISPPYQPTDDMCLSFWYHMKGPVNPGEVGDLDVYIRTEADTDEGHNDWPVFHKESHQDNDWLKGEVTIPPQTSIYRVVFAATRRESWTGDIALDDVRVYNCSSPFESTTMTTFSTTINYDDGDDDDDDGDDAQTTPRRRRPTTTKTTTKRTTPTTTTQKSTTATPKSTTATPKPTTVTPKPTTATPRPTTATPRPTTATPKPTTTAKPTTTTRTTTTMTTSKPATTTTTEKPTTTAVPTTTTTMKTTTLRTTMKEIVTSEFPTTLYEFPTKTIAKTMKSYDKDWPTSNQTIEIPTTKIAIPPKETVTMPERFTQPSSSPSLLTAKYSDQSTTSPSTPPEDSFIATTINTESFLPDEYSGARPTPDSSTSNSDYENIGDGDEGSGQGEDKDFGDGGDDPGVGNQRSSSAHTAADYLPLIVGVTLGLAVGMVVVGALAMMWARNRRKQKERQVEEDQMNIIGSIEGNPYTTYASEH